ncbi:hypothetical protein [Paenibacillus sp. GP183]|jgi:hypothetical protein|uniref:hypothetical protein n=1 Tax=Paenibacillus sp. GP183 TaxID=1882751 RepID=UPI0008941C01|nr:hypothetical protein [Paenibacillus sp. GP183]SEB41400.1 hypothetical protein SAMN05443246_0138 [Paenibacillus sp. GP183]
MSRNNYSIGMILIAVAVVLLLGKLGVFHFLGFLLWPLLILVPGLLLHFLFFNRVLPAGVLVPGGMLITYSLMFFFCNLFGWHAMGYIWPGFIFGVAVGLYEFYIFNRDSDRNIRTVSIVLAVLAAALFLMMILFKVGIYLIALLLVLAGILIIMRKPRVW